MFGTSQEEHEDERAEHGDDVEEDEDDQEWRLDG